MSSSSVLKSWRVADVTFVEFGCGVRLVITDALIETLRAGNGVLQ